MTGSKTGTGGPGVAGGLDRFGNRVGFWVCCAVFPAVLLAASPAWSAPAMKVTDIRVGGRQVPSAPKVVILRPDAKKHETITLAVGTDLEAGTEIVAPPNTEITLTSLNGNAIKLLQANTHFKVIGVSASGETFEVLRGKIAVFVNKQLSFFNVGSGPIAAAAKRTEYTVAVGPMQDVVVEVTEGAVEVERPARLAVSGAEFGGYKSRETLNAGGERQVARAEQPQRFDSLEDARAAFQQARAAATKRGDLSAAAEWQYNWANLVYDSAQNIAAALEAARQFDAGSKLPIARQDPRWAVLFAEGAGDSFFDAEQFQEAERRHRAALDLLERELDPTLESFLAADLLVSLGNDYLELDQPDMARDRFLQALDVFEDDFESEYDDEAELELGSVYYSLGVAYHRLEEWDEAQEYFEEALEIYQDLAPKSRLIAAIEKHLDEVEDMKEDQDEEADFVDFDLE